MATTTFSMAGLAALATQLRRLVADGFVPGALAMLARHGEVRVEHVGALATTAEAHRH